MSRSISTYDFSKVVKQKLIKAGYSSESCFKGITPLTLSKEAQLSVEEALQVIKTVCNAEKQVEVMQLSAYTLAQKEAVEGAVVTFSQKIDAMFGEGIPLGKITEICGVPGIGKTQFSMQLSVDATIPECFGGVQGQAIYIDTEGSFVAERVAQIAQATVNHCHFVANATTDKEMFDGIKNFNTDFILKSIHYFRCNSCIELIALAHQLPDFITKHCKNVKMIAVDSFAFHFRHDWDDMSNRTRVMNSLAQQFMKIACTFNSAVVFVNQMTTKIVSSGRSSKVVPALGESWSHVPTNRMLLFWQANCRYANLFKSPNRKEDTVPYTITADGIRDVEENRDIGEEPFNKKPRTTCM